jgi:hypothetical protein
MSTSPFVKPDNKKELPDNIFVTIPDETIVNVPISGAWFRILQQVHEYLITSVDEKIVIETAVKIKSDFKDVKEEDVTLFDTAFWAISMLLAEISNQAAAQDKAKVYDREKFLASVRSALAPGAEPLTDKELQIILEKGAISRETDPIAVEAKKFVDPIDDEDKPTED